MRNRAIIDSLAVALGLVSMAVAPAAFSASSEQPVAGFDYFTMLEEPVDLPEVAVVNAEGREVVLANREDDLLLINIWATWCAPCIDEMPALDALQGDLGGAAFEVVTVSQDRTGMEAVRPFFKKLEIENLSPYADPDTEFGQVMGARGLPVTFLVKDGRVIGRAVGPEEWAGPAAKRLIRKHLD